MCLLAGEVWEEDANQFDICFVIRQLEPSFQVKVNCLALLDIHISFDLNK